MLHMSTNSNFTYAVHILTFLAQSQEPQSSAFIAESINTNPVTIRKLMGVLREAGLVDTVHGSSGGAILKKSAAAITLGDVYMLVKDEHPFGLHPSDPNPNCLIGRNIQKILVRIFDETDNLIFRALMKISIQDIVDEVLVQEAATQ